MSKPEIRKDDLVWSYRFLKIAQWLGLVRRSPAIQLLRGQVYEMKNNFIIKVSLGL